MLAAHSDSRKQGRHTEQGVEGYGTDTEGVEADKEDIKTATRHTCLL